MICTHKHAYKDIRTLVLQKSKMNHTVKMGERRISSKEAEAKVQVDVVENLEYQDETF